MELKESVKITVFGLTAEQMATRIQQVCVYLWFMPVLMTTMFGGTAIASGVKQNGKYATKITKFLVL